MKIVVFAPGIPPGTTSGGGRIHLILRCFVEAGSEAEVWLLNGQNMSDKYILIDGVKYISCARLQSGKFRKFFAEAKIFLRLIYVVTFKIKRGNIIILFPSFDFRLVLLVIARMRGIKVVLEINEYPLVHKINNFKNRIKQRFIISSFWLYSGAIVISEELKKLVESHTKSKTEILKIPVISISPEKTIDSDSPLTTQYILHAGSLTESKDGILGIIKAFALTYTSLQNKTKLVITGNCENSPDVNAIINIINDYDLKGKIIFTGFLDRITLAQYLQNSKLGIINKKNNMQNKYCFATKLSEYLAYGIPVIATKVGESMNYLTDGINSILVEPENIKELTNAIANVLNNNDIAGRLSIKGEELFYSQFYYKNYVEKLNKFLIEL